MKQYPRRYRIASVLQEALAPLMRHVSERGLVTLRSVSLNNDCSVATIIYGIVGDDREAVQVRLDDMAVAYRLQLAKRLNMRKTPQLIFQYDDEGLAADKMRDFLENISISDS